MNFDQECFPLTTHANNFVNNRNINLLYSTFSVFKKDTHTCIRKISNFRTNMQKLIYCTYFEYTSKKLINKTHLFSNFWAISEEFNQI